MKAKQSKFWKKIDRDKQKLARSIVNKAIEDSKSFEFILKGKVYKCNQI